jgi:16S rRNA (uracil1498-N3)-methyltransferase
MRRLHVSQLSVGEVRLPEREAHHARDVLRLAESDEVELFDDAGQVARGVVREANASSVIVAVEKIRAADRREVQITVACAVPKGDRADWLVEKLSELGVDRFIPLQTDRSVVLPTGKGKRDRWLRLAVEAAKQSRRAGVMQIDELTPLDRVVESTPAQSVVWFFSTEDEGAVPIGDAIQSLDAKEILLLIGPEGGWTSREIAAMRERNLTPVRLTATILRVETAAVAAAAIVASLAH